MCEVYLRPYHAVLANARLMWKWLVKARLCQKHLILNFGLSMNLKKGSSTKVYFTGTIYVEGMGIRTLYCNLLCPCLETFKELKSGKFVLLTNITIKLDSVSCTEFTKVSNCIIFFLLLVYCRTEC